MLPSWSKSPPSRPSSKLSSKSNLFLCDCVLGEPSKVRPVVLLLLLVLLLPLSRVWMRGCCCCWLPLEVGEAPSSKPRGSTSEAVSSCFVGGWFCRRRLANRPKSRFLELCRRLNDAAVGEADDAGPSASPA